MNVAVLVDEELLLTSFRGQTEGSLISQSCPGNPVLSHWKK
jgi:hypothetical protein